jgi:hypothetical protein
MRLLIASMAALAAVAFAAPSLAQDENAPAPVPTAKSKPGTAAYCQKLKSASSRSACLKKISAQAAPKAAPMTTAKKAKKAPATPTAPKQPDVGQLAPPAAAPAFNGTVAVPPLPQKTI